MSPYLPNKLVVFFVVVAMNIDILKQLLTYYSTKKKQFKMHQIASFFWGGGRACPRISVYAEYIDDEKTAISVVWNLIARLLLSTIEFYAKICFPFFCSLANPMPDNNTDEKIFWSLLKIA